MTAPAETTQMTAPDASKTKLIKMRVQREALVYNCKIVRTDGEEMQADKKGLVATEGQIIYVDEKQAQELEKSFGNVYAFSGPRSNEDAQTGIGKIQKAIRC